MKRNWQTLRRILPYLRPYWKLAVFALVLTLLAALFSLLLPWPLALMFDSVLGDRPLPGALNSLFGSVGKVPLIVLLAVSAVGLSAMQGVFGLLEQYITAKVDQYMTLEFRSDLFRHAQRLSFAYHDQRRTGQFVAQINLQASSAGNLIVAIPPILQSIATLVGMLVVALSINVKLTLLVVSVVPFIYYSTHHYTRRIEPRLIKVRGMEGESLSIVHEAMAMLRVIVPFGLESHHYERFREQGERAVAARVDLTVRQTVFSVIVNVLTAIGTALVLGYGAYLILQGQFSGGRLLVMMTYTASAYQPLEQMAATIGSLQEQFVNARGALALRDAQVEIEDAPDAVDIERARGEIAFEGVDFSYQRRVDTLKDISFETRAGQRVALVGPTGAGKTTLISLLPRFYDPARGRILLDGTDLRKLTLASLRRQISIVLQEPLLFSGTIAENIRYGRLGASREDIVQAAKDANAHDFIMRLPDQYETRLGERGAQLSGGERQRISVARAFLKDAPICILDEPTSSIDSRTEAVILDSLERLMVGRTTFMIAHRLSTVRNADLILVLNHGRLVEQGTHDELLGRESLYQQLHVAQTGQVQHKESLEQFERLELSIQEGSMNAGHADMAFIGSHNGSREAEPAPREREARPVSSNEDDTPGRDAQRPAGREPNAAAESRAEHAPVPRMTSLPRVVHERLWLTALGAVVLSGFATGFAQVAAPQYGVLVFALVTGLALLAGLVCGTGTALLVEYVARRRRGSVFGVSASQAQGTVGEDAHQRRTTEAEPWALFHLGSDFDRQGEYDLAVEAYQQAIDSQHPEAAPRAAFNLGLMLDEQGEYERAVEAYQQAIDSKHAEWAPKAAFNLGMLFEERGEYDLAEESYQQAINSQHSDAAPKARLNLGVLFEQMGEYDLAEESYQQAIDSRHPEVAPEAVGNFLGLLRRLTARESSDKESSEP
jgi:ATP-binding cassette subfamily B protein